MIKKEGSSYTLYSKDGKKKLGSGTKEQMEKREQQVAYFKEVY